MESDSLLVLAMVGAVALIGVAVMLMACIWQVVAGRDNVQ